VYELEDVRKDILFIDSQYNTLFKVKDGDSIKLTVAFDGEVKKLKCRFIDEAHIQLIGNYRNDYHICEFAEKMERAGNKYESIPGQKPMLNILAAKYGENLQDMEIPMTEAAVKKLVGGKYEATKLYSASGKHVFGALLRGKDGVVVCGIEGDALTSLHPYWANSYKRELSPVEKPEPEKTDLLGKVDKFKAKAAAQESAPTNPRKLRDGLA
jgi:hypothetical protein